MFQILNASHRLLDDQIKELQIILTNEAYTRELPDSNFFF